jgi:cysteinyl-tRNA synthetase
MLYIHLWTDNGEWAWLCYRKLDQNRAGERVAVDTRKRNPADFALWKVILVHLCFYLRNDFMQTTI